MGQILWTNRVICVKIHKSASLMVKCGTKTFVNLMDKCIIYSGTIQTFTIGDIDMTHEESSLQTKLMLCSSLKEIMKHKAFSKITVSELIKDCNLNRKTFYYHFEDIYGLLKWMLEQEAIEVVKQFDLISDYEQAFNFVMDYVEKNAYFLNCIYDSVGRDELKRFFYNDFVGIVGKIIDDYEINHNITITDNFRAFVVDFYTEAVAGMVINLFKNSNSPDHPSAHCDRKTMLDYFYVVMNYSLPALLENAPE